MRHPTTTTTLTALAAGLFLLLGARPADGGPAGELYGAELPAGQVLPVRGIDLPVDPTAPGGSRAYALSPQVQAIPTPTAFGAGAVALTVLLVTRAAGGRRRRASAMR